MIQDHVIYVQPLFIILTLPDDLPSFRMADRFETRCLAVTMLRQLMAQSNKRVFIVTATHSLQLTMHCAVQCGALDTITIMHTYLFLNVQAFQTKIVGGQDADPKDFPWLVLFGEVDRKGNIDEEDFSCGGSVISSYWVLTASHCICRSGTTELFDK